MPDNLFDGTFAPIPGFEGYEISTDGALLSKRCKTHKIIRGHTDSAGYQRHILQVDGGELSVHAHRLVLLAHIGPPPTPKHVAAHNDGDRQNNALSNLRWATQAENVEDTRQHGNMIVGERRWNAKLTSDIARQVYARAVAGESHRKIAEELGVPVSSVWLIANGRQWASVTGAPRQTGIKHA